MIGALIKCILGGFMNKRLLVIILTLTSIIFVFSLTSILETRESYKKYASTSLSDDILAYNNNFESLLKILNKDSSSPSKKLDFFRLKLADSRFLNIDYLFDFIINLDSIFMKKELSSADISLLNEFNTDLNTISEYINLNYPPNSNKFDFIDDIKEENNYIKITYLNINSKFE